MIDRGESFTIKRKKTLKWITVYLSKYYEIPEEIRPTFKAKATFVRIKEGTYAFTGISIDGNSPWSIGKSSSSICLSYASSLSMQIRNNKDLDVFIERMENALSASLSSYINERNLPRVYKWWSSLKRNDDESYKSDVFI